MEQPLNADDIKKIIPHREPFLFVDRVTEIGPDMIVGFKDVSINEPFFKGHFPGRPIMPGVIVVEALAQLGGIHLMRDPQYEGKTPLFLSIDRAKFRRQVVPGETLRLEIKIVQSRRGIVKMEGRATVAGNLACEVAITAGVM